jgi:hypothetical protein
MTNDTTTPQATTTPEKVKRAPAPKASKKAVKAKAAKKVKAVKKTNGEASKSVIPLDVAKSYTRAKDKAGKLHIDCADDVATMLRGKGLDDIYVLVAKKSETPEKELRAKYTHLNVGMQRMNLGNRLRALLNPKE